MKRLVCQLEMGIDQREIANWLLTAEGLCACNRVLTHTTHKFILGSIPPTSRTMTFAAYCLPCAVEINETFKRLHKIMYGKDVDHAG